MQPFPNITHILSVCYWCQTKVIQWKGFKWFHRNKTNCISTWNGTVLQYFQYPWWRYRYLTIKHFDAIDICYLPNNIRLPQLRSLNPFFHLSFVHSLVVVPLAHIPPTSRLELVDWKEVSAFYAVPKCVVRGCRKHFHANVQDSLNIARSAFCRRKSLLINLGIGPPPLWRTRDLIWIAQFVPSGLFGGYLHSRTQNP